MNSDDVMPPIVCGLVIRPGDTLLVRVATVTAEQAQGLRSALMERLPELADVVVLGADGVSVFRPELKAVPA